MAGDAGSIRLRRPLSIDDHDRAIAGMRYVYPVLSRRAGGVSLGINLNPNNACDWHCAYCQVPGLVRGHAPAIELGRLERELEELLDLILRRDFLAGFAPEGMRQLRDLAISGNGEPTSAAEFADVIALIGRAMARFSLVGRMPLRLITNGSYMGKAHVQRGLAQMARLGGEVWIKIDAADPENTRRINGVRLDAGRLYRQAVLSAGCCATWIQTCMFAWDGKPPGEAMLGPYLALLERLARCRTPPQGVLLYGPARPVMQAEAAHVSAVSRSWLETLAGRIRALGLEARVH